MLWVKAFHIISVIAWMAALLYLPRLMVYHTATAIGSEQSETFKVMERRLLRAIATPAMIATWVFGLWLASLLGVWSEGWLHAKLTLVILLSAYHALLARWVRPARTYRIANEVPTIVMIAIVILVVVKPF